MDEFEIIGQQFAEALRRENKAADLALLAQASGIDVSGIGAFDWTQVVNAAAESANKGIQYKAQQDATNKQKASDAQALQKAVAADINWASAEGQLALAQSTAATGHTTVPQSTQVLQAQAMAGAMAAGQGLSPDGQAQRAAAAQKQLTDAATAAQASPHDSLKAAMLQAWQKVSGAIASGGAGGAAPDAGAVAKYQKHGESWWTSPQIWGVPGWGVAVGGTGIAVAVFLLLKHLFGRK